MQGLIGFEELTINCVIGIYPHERELEQKLIIDLKVEFDFEKSISTDNIKDTIDYQKLADAIKTAAEHKYSLLETFAYHACQKILKEFPVSKVWIRLRKPSALTDAKNSFIELEQTR